MSDETDPAEASLASLAQAMVTQTSDTDRAADPAVVAARNSVALPPIEDFQNITGGIVKGSSGGRIELTPRTPSAENLPEMPNASFHRLSPPSREPAHEAPTAPQVPDAEARDDRTSPSAEETPAFAEPLEPREAPASHEIQPARDFPEGAESPVPSELPGSTEPGREPASPIPDETPDAAEPPLAAVPTSFELPKAADLSKPLMSFEAPEQSPVPEPPTLSELSQPAEPERASKKDDDFPQGEFLKMFPNARPD